MAGVPGTPGPSSFKPLRDGYATIFTINALPQLVMHEREVTPPGLDGGGGIESTTMRHARWRTKDPKTLVGLTDLSAVLCYPTSTYVALLNILNVPTSCTLIWPDGARLVVYGAVDKFTPTGHQFDNLPTANFVFLVSNRNHVTGAEAGPAFTPSPFG